MATARPLVASPVDRWWARIIDGFLVSVAVIPVYLLLGVMDRGDWWPFVAVALYWPYEVVMTAATGQTIGKRWTRIRVVDVETGAVPTAWASALRAVPTLLVGIPYLGLVALAAWLPIFWHRRRQGWHDRLARTAVIAEPR